ncbi:MAG: DUF3822 family protein [Psychroflexus sp.]|nr:DUF3822 family protein [Psychroflexus sp.]MDN6309739.1 DUF3822 family protein [Psychroflexus sp.]
MAITTNIYSSKNFKKLSILLSQDGLSFLYLNADNAFVHEVYQDYRADEAIPLQAENLINEELKKFTDFQFAIDLIYQNIDYTLAPSSLVEHHNMSDFIKYNVQLYEGDNYSKDSTNFHDISTLFIPFANVNNQLVETFGEFKHEHQTSRYLKILGTSHYSHPHCYCFINQHQVDIAILSQNKLELYNTFTAETVEDVIYVILYCLEVNAFDRTEIQLQLINFVRSYKEKAFSAYLEYYIKKFEFKDMITSEHSDLNDNPHLHNHLFMNSL